MHDVGTAYAGRFAKLAKLRRLRRAGAVLVACREEILSDAINVLAEATVEVVDEQRNARLLAEAAIAAAAEGHDKAAQALIAAALGRVLHRVLRYETLGEAYRKMSQRDIEEAFNVMRLVTIEASTSRTLVDTKDHVEGLQQTRHPARRH